MSTIVKTLATFRNRSRLADRFMSRLTQPTLKPTTGGVLESHEVAGESYNNISGPVLSTAGPVDDGSVSPAGTDEYVPASCHLPPRL